MQKQILFAVILIAGALLVRELFVDEGESLPPRTGAPAGSKGAPMDGGEKVVVDVSSGQATVISDTGSGSGGGESAAAETAVQHASKHADPTYICPMHPDISSKDPNATCPLCGMDLVLVDNSGEADVVTISPNVINLLGVRTDQVKRRNIYRKIDTVGHVVTDETRERNINLRTQGWLERMAVKSVGDRVKKGQLLFELYSPVLVNAQEEYLHALDVGSDLLLSASRERLKSLGVSSGQIKSLEKSGKVQQRVKVYAPQDGIVKALHVKEGSFVPPSKSIITLSDISKIWLVANVFERQADWVRVGNRAKASLPFYPDKVWEGMVDYIYPSVDEKTRSLKVRMVFDNADEALKPNMYADVKLFAKPKKKTLAIPREALIRTGNNDRVIIDLGEGRFKPVTVKAGIETDSRVEILSGLKEGDTIVVSSQFLIDSESSLRASLMRMGAQ